MLRSFGVPTLLFLLAYAPAAPSQSYPQLDDPEVRLRVPLQVQILLRGEPIRKSISLTLQDSEGNRPITFYTDSRGRVALWHLEARKEYTLTVYGDGEFYVTTQVHVTGDAEALRINLVPLVDSPAAGDSAAPPNKKAIKLHREALKLWSKGKAFEAEERLRKAVKLDPNFTAPQLDLAALLVQHHRNAEAEVILRQAAQAHPNDQVVLVRLGILRHVAGDQSEAMQLFKRVLHFEQHLPNGHLYLGACLLHQNQIEEAYQHLNHYLEAPDANRPLAHYYLGHVHMRRSNFEKAITSFEQFLAGLPASTNAEAVRRTIEQLKGRIQTAPEH